MFYGQDQEWKKREKGKIQGSETGSTPGGLVKPVITSSSPSKGRHQKKPATIAKRRNTGEMNVLKSIIWPVLNVLILDIGGETAPLIRQPEVQNPFLLSPPWSEQL